MLARALVVASILWPLTLAAAVVDRVSHPVGERSVWAAAVYAAAHLVCHQKPERTLHTGDVAWPVCARCTGLYLAAPIGALLFLAWRRRWPMGIHVVAFAALPTAATVAWEWAGLGMPAHSVRLLTALPLGMAVTMVLLDVAAEPPVPAR